MKVTTIRELKHDTSKVLAWVAEGTTVEVRRRGRPVAVLSAPRPARRRRRPDFAGRMHAIYGSTLLPVTATALLAEARGDR